MSRIFVSYDRADDKFVRRIVNELRSNGVKLWLDVDDIPVGVEWGDVINAEMKQCDVMLLIISPDAMTNDNVTYQWKHFLSKNKRIIPILYRAAEIPARLSHFQPIDFQRQSVTQKLDGTAEDREASYYAGVYQQGLLKLLTAIRDQQSTDSSASASPRKKLDGWVTILAAIVISGVVLSTLFVPIASGIH